MAVDCLVPTNEKEKLLVDKMGERAAYRLFMKYENLGKDRAVDKALADLDARVYSPEEKRRKLASGFKRVQVHKEFDGEGKETSHSYKSTVKDSSGNYLDIRGISEVLDDSPETEYNGSDAGKKYAEKGQAFHKIMELIFRDTLGDTELAGENLNILIKEEGIPRSFVDSMVKLKNRLDRTGKTYLTEAVVEDIDADIAGTADLIHINDNGTIDLYDLKTAFFTSGMMAQGETTSWNPATQHDGYKSRRYHAQLEFYSRLIENMTGIPVSNKYIVPVEVYNEDNDIDKPYKEVKLLEPENVEAADSENWFWGRNARRMVDRYFGTEVKAQRPTAVNPQGINETLANLIGTYEVNTFSAEKEAEKRMLTSVRTVGGIKRYFNKLLKRPIPFNDQNDYEAQKNQIIQEETSKSVRYKNDISESVFNWLENGKDALLAGKKFESSPLYRILNKYKINDELAPGTEVYSLDSIDGFADKKNWVVIQRNNQTDLIYIGDENLQQKIPISNRKRSFGRMLFGDTLFGKYYTSGEANYLLKSKLKNTVADAKKFEAGLIMMELKSSNSNLRFGDTMITSLGPGSAFATHVDLEMILPVINNLITSKNKEIRDILPKHFQEYRNNRKLFDWKSYRPDTLGQYKTFIKTVKGIRDQNTIKGINDYYKDKINKQELDSIVLSQISDINSYTEKSKEQETQLRMLSMMHAELVGMNIYKVEPIKITKEWLSMPTNINNSIIQRTVASVSTALKAISADFFSYKPASKNKLNNLFKDQRGITDVATDYTVGNTSKYYEGLFQKVTIETGAGKQEQVRSFELIEEGSEQFSKLSEAQQDFIIFFNDTIQDYVEKIRRTTDANFSWRRGRVPLMHDTFANRVYKLMYAKSEGQDTSDYGSLSEEFFQNMEEGFTFESGSSESKDNIAKPLTNPFLWQTNDEFGGGRWEEARGIMQMENGNYAVDPVSNFNGWTSNLEVILDMFVINAIRVEQFNKIMPEFAAAENIFKWQTSQLFEDRLGGAVNWLKVWKEGTLENRSQDAGTPLDKIVRTLNKTASIALIGFRPQTAIFATAAQEVTSMSQAIAQTFAKSNSFNIKDWSKAGLEVWNPKNITSNGRAKIDELLSEYRMFNHDFSSIVNGYHRAGNKSMFRTKYIYSMLNAGDWATRSQILVAQMMHDGVWEAYTFDSEGNLTYDETKDKRFQSPEGQVLKKTLKESLAKENGLNPDGTMKRAYDSKQSESLKFEADSIVGGFDRETRAKYNYYALGKLMMMFKTWLPAKLNKGFDSEFVNEVAGSYELIETENGEKEMVWKGKQMEGIMFSLMNAAFNLKQYMRQAETSELTQVQQENLFRLLGDLLIISAVGAMASALPGALEDDEGKLSFFEKDMIRIIARSTEDLIATYNVWQFAVDFGTPISIGYMIDLVNNIWNAAMATTDPNDSSLEYLMDTTTLGRDVYKWTNEEE